MRQRALRPPFQLPNRALAGRLFGRAALLTDLVGRLKRREHVDIWGPAGMGKTALAAEAIHAVVGDNPDNLSATPYPDGVVLLDLYRLKFASPEPAWSHLADAFDASLPPRTRQRSVPSQAAAAAAPWWSWKAPRKRATAAPCSVAESFSAGNYTGNPDARQAPGPYAQTIECRGSTCAPRGARVVTRIVRDTASKPTSPQVHQRFGGHPLALTWAGRQLAAGEESPRVFSPHSTPPNCPTSINRGMKIIHCVGSMAVVWRGLHPRRGGCWQRLDCWRSSRSR